jgi:hypothetical protein
VPICVRSLLRERDRERERARRGERERESRLDEGVLDETTEVELLAASA